MSALCSNKCNSPEARTARAFAAPADHLPRRSQATASAACRRTAAPLRAPPPTSTSQTFTARPAFLLLLLLERLRPPAPVPNDAAPPPRRRRAHPRRARFLVSRSGQRDVPAVVGPRRCRLVRSHLDGGASAAERASRVGGGPSRRAGTGTAVSAPHAPQSNGRPSFLALDKPARVLEVAGFALAARDSLPRCSPPRPKPSRLRRLPPPPCRRSDQDRGGGARPLASRRRPTEIATPPSSRAKRARSTACGIRSRGAPRLKSSPPIAARRTVRSLPEARRRRLHDTIASARRR